MVRNTAEARTYIVWDMYGRKWHAWLLLRPATDEDLVEQRSSVQIIRSKEFRDGYWLYLDLSESRLGITHMNLMDGWTAL